MVYVVMCQGISKWFCLLCAGIVEATEHTPDQTSLSQVKSSNEMRVMTGSDKLLRWNIVGIQGADLSLFTHPVYLNSISLGGY